MALSDLQIKKLAPKSKRFEIPDGAGLYLRVSPTGTKTWIFRYMMEGRARRLTLGTYPTISLSGAREKAAKEDQDVKQGIDPGVKKQQERAARKAAPTVADMIQEFWDMELSVKASGKEQLRLLSKDVVPVWGERKVAEITRRDAVLLIDGVRKRGNVVANRTQAAMVRLFNFAAERGVIDHSPLAGMKKKTEQPRQRALFVDEIKLFWNACEMGSGVDVFCQTKLALKMILLTGQRPGEVAGMTWSEIDGDAWNIPAERRKGRVAQSVPLCPLALEIIEQARLLSRQSRFVFTSSIRLDKAVTTHSLSKALLRHWKEIGVQEPFTPHDLRRTCRTGLAGLQIDDVVAERVLGHKLGGILGTYNVHAYDNEKRQALEKWERHIRQILGLTMQGRGGNIIQLQRVA